MANTVTSLDAGLKEYYNSKKLEPLWKGDSPFYNKIEQKQGDLVKLGGKNYVRVVVRVAPAGGVSSVNADAKAMAIASSSLVLEFQVPVVKTSVWATVDDDLMRMASTDAHSFLKASEFPVQDAMEIYRRTMCRAVHSDGWGTLGQISTTMTVTSSTTITLENTSDAEFFEPGMQLDVATNKGDVNKTRGSSGNGLIVTAVDTTTGTLTFSAAIDDSTDGVPAIAAGDYLYMRGDAQTTRTKIVGMPGYLVSGPSPGTLFGLNRNVQPQRLAGVHVDGTFQNIKDATNALLVDVSKRGGKVDMILCSHETYKRYLDALSTDIVGVAPYKMGQFGFEGVKVSTARGVVEIHPDLFCPDNIVRAITSSSWAYYTVGDRLYNVGTGVGDGLKLRLDETEDRWYFRYSSLGALACHAPGHNGTLTLASA